ncbi:YdgA family protein [Guyparkeria hydrothermalis]|uniref:DUF945 family protein n=1 Tax=Guyparkeria hydrothermalis TaxID=923 RepID=UPI002022016B|nr:DUF945 family protein [Guyparkeria hydrothermalis]MCL7744573.1 YdgA family protein [Guyparkeria hydrothermalis]
MKRLILAVVVVLAAAVAAAPFVTGHVMERTLAEVKHFPGTRQALSLEVSDYQRGYLESRAESELLLHLPEQEPVRVKLTHRIDQLPGLDGRYATVHTRWEPADPLLRGQLAEVFGDEAEFTLTTALYPTGGTRSTGRVPMVDREGVTFSGADLMLETSADGGFDYAIESERLAVDEQAEGVEAGARATAEGLRLVASGKVADDGFVWDSEGRMSVDSMQVAEPDGTASIEDLTVGFDSSREDDLFRFAIDYQVGEATIEGESFRNARMRLAVERLDAEAVRTIAERIEELQELAASGADVEQAVAQVMREELPALLSRGPRIAIDPLQATTAEGDTEMALSVEVPAGVVKGEPNPMMWMALISAMAVEGSLKMPLALLEKQAAAQGRAGQVEEQLAPLVAQGWIAVEDNVVKTTVDFRQGNLELNGTSANQLLNMALGGG